MNSVKMVIVAVGCLIGFQANIYGRDIAPLIGAIKAVKMKQFEQHLQFDYTSDELDKAIVEAQNHANRALPTVGMVWGGVQAGAASILAIICLAAVLFTEEDDDKASAGFVGVLSAIVGGAGGLIYYKSNEAKQLSELIIEKLIAKKIEIEKIG